MKNIYFELKKIADNFNIKIYDDFIGEKTFIWRINNQSESLIMPAKHLNISQKIELLVTELKKRDLENAFLMPNLRELIENFNSTNGDILFEKKHYCRVCGNELDKKNSSKTSMLEICPLCLRMQVRYNIDYLKCSKEATGRYCLDCPSTIFKNCPVAKKKLNPEKFLAEIAEHSDITPKLSKLNRLSGTNARFSSNAQGFVR